ncbi:MAG: ABC transporter ATP-binding protein [Syntrophorhabdales bacterium]|jgi:branched-chain amino acid transport system ATP-binding protein
MLQLIDVHTYYGDSYVLQGVSLEVGKASVVALLGRNGMGKTTTIYSIIGFTRPRQGRILFKGVNISGLEPFKINRLGISLVPQGRRIFKSLSVRENLNIVSNRDGITRKMWDIDKLMLLFPRLKERINTKAKYLSGGEMQMLAIARALMSNPELLLMDEPSEGLSPIHVREVGHVIRQVTQETGSSILLVEQNFGLAIDVADYVYIINRGKIEYESTPQELRGNDEVKNKYLGV